MKKLACLLIAVLLIAACRKSRSNDPVPVPDHEFDDIIVPIQIALPNWKEEMLVATIFSNDSVPVGTDSLLAYVHAGEVFLRYEGKPYRVNALHFGKGAIDENAPAYQIQVSTLEGDGVAVGTAQPATYIFNGQKMTARQSIRISSERPPFNKTSAPYMGK